MAVSFVLVLGLPGCGASVFQTTRLPLPAQAASYTFPAIAAVAADQGLEVARFDDSVHVRLDEVSWAYYTVQLNEYNLVIQLDADAVPQAEQEARLRSAREMADRIWVQALGRISMKVTPAPLH